MRLSNPRGSVAAGGRPESSLSKLTPTSMKRVFPPSIRRISTAASPSAPPSPTRDGGASAHKGGPLRSSHDHYQQQRGHAAAAAAAAASAASSPAVADVVDVVDVGLLPAAQPPLRVSFASFPRFESAFPNALSSRRRLLDDEAFRRKKEQLLSQSPPSSLSPIAEHESDTDAAEEPAPSTSQPTLAAAPHDSKLALFYNVYGPRPTAAAGRGESARAARDALALFHAVYGPPKHLQLLEEEEEAAAAAAAASSAAAEELSSLSSRPPSPPRSSLSPLRLQRAAAPAASPASSYSSCSPSSSSAPSSSPRATTTIAPSRPSPSSPAPPSARRRLSFSRPLARGVVLERPNRFTMRVRLLETGETVSCHCPVTGALGGLGLGAFEGAGAPCLVSRVADEDDAGVAGEAAGGGGGGGGARKKAKKYYARKTPFTVEAVSLADPRGPPSWVGINQMAANRYFEHFWNAGALPELSSSGSGSGPGSRSPGPGPRPASGANEDGSAAPPPSSRDGGGGGAALVRETRIGDTRSRLDFAASGGRDLVEVKCPLDALPLLRDSSESSFSSSPSSSPSSPGSSSSTGLRPNPVLASAAALRAQTAGERLARLPRAKRAAMYERAARHASVLAEHLAMAKKRERAAATRARRRATAAAKREAAEAAEGAFSSSPSASSGPSAPSSPLQRALALASLEGDEGEDDEPPLEGEELEPEERGARALLIQCFQFDAPPVRGMLPPPKGADPASDGRAAVAAAMRSAARAGVETWQVNMSFDERGVELLGCFKLDLFSASSSSAAASGSLKKGRNSRKKTESSSSSSLSVAATASSSSEAAPDPAPASSPSRFESFSSFSSSSSSSSSSSGDESDDGGALVAA